MDILRIILDVIYYLSIAFCIYFAWKLLKINNERMRLLQPIEDNLKNNVENIEELNANKKTINKKYNEDQSRPKKLFLVSVAIAIISLIVNSVFL